MSPQLYWPRTRPTQSFDVLLDHWASPAPRRGHLWLSRHDSAAMAPEPGWANDEIDTQVRTTRARRRAGGNVHFSLGALARGAPTLGTQMGAELYAQAALTPPTPWRPAQPCGAPRLTGARTAGRLQLEIKVVPGASRRAAVWTRANEAKWQLDVCPIDAAGHATFTLDADPATSLHAIAFAVTGNGLLSDRSEHCW